MTTRQPDFGNLLAVFSREQPSRPTLFEFFLNDRLLAKLTGDDRQLDWNSIAFWNRAMAGFAAAGYDGTPVRANTFEFPRNLQHSMASYSMDETAVIGSEEDLAAYGWPDPMPGGLPILDGLAPHLPGGMKLIAWGPGGVLENVITLMGFTGLCYLLEDEPDLVRQVFDGVGSRLLEYFGAAAQHPAVGACFVSDDWGFLSGTMISPESLREYCFPWQKRICDAIHAAGKPALMHSCGQLSAVMDDIIDMGFDAKHSFEDKITPVEEAFTLWGSRIAILGGIDVDFLCRSEPEAITRRARGLLDQTQSKGYALGSGNSIPYYVPDEGFFAMTKAALEA